MKRLLSAVLCVCLVPSPMAFAREPARLPVEQVLDLARKLTLEGSPRSFQTMRAAGITGIEMDSALKKMSESKAADVTAHVGQTLLFILTMAGVDLVYQEIQKSGGVAAQTPKSLLQLAEKSTARIADASLKLINSGKTWSSLIGAGIVGKLLEVPVSAFTAILADPKARQLLFERLRGSILMTGGQIGWDIGAQLVTEAANRLEYPVDYERSGNLFGVAKGTLLGAAKGTLFGWFFPDDYNDYQDKRDMRLTGLMLENIFKVALFSDLRADWFNNAWRTRLMTGEIATFLVGVAASTAAGTMILPGGGSVAMFMFGVVGAFAAWSLPQSFQDRITVHLQALRNRMTWSYSLYNNAYEIRERMLTLRPVNPLVGDYRDLELPLALRDRHTLRSNYITVDFEGVRINIRALLQSKGDAKVIAKARAGIRAAFADAAEFYRKETETIIGFTDRATRINPVPTNRILQLQKEMSRLEFLTQFVGQVGDELEEALNQQPAGQFSVESLSDSGKDLIQYVEIAYARRFKEDKVLEAAGQEF